MFLYAKYKGFKTDEEWRFKKMAEKEEIFEARDSIKVNCTSKGAFSFEVKRYYDFRYDDPELVIKSIEKIYGILKGKFKGELGG